LRYDRIARLYDILDLPFEHGRYKPLRKHLFEGLSGQVLDSGVGTGRNMPFYPSGTQVVGIDISRGMLRRAQKRRTTLGVDAPLALMDVCATGFRDGTFDAVVATFLFCVLPSELQLPALRELRRICRPGGAIRILEYAYSQDPVRRFVMHLWAPWVRLVYGAAFDRETEWYMPDAGLELVEQRFLYRDIVKLLIARPRELRRW
jgi:ubiquinone/menaquinone biosynthesis C-methylase UbiE